MSEPTLTDVLHAIAKLDVRLTEVHASLAEFRLSTAERFEDVSRRLTTLFDEVAAFRAEYNAHTHE
jgi:hypothetical protein